MAGPAPETVATGAAAARASTAHPGPTPRFPQNDTWRLARVGLGTAIWPFLDTMDPSKNVHGAIGGQVDLTAIPVGSGITMIWQGKPILVRHRSPAEITAKANVDILQLDRRD